MIDGERELAAGLRLVPTPGHTAGHQSMIVDTNDGPVVLLGQAAPGASDFGLLAYHRQLELEGDLRHPPLPDWLPRIMAERPVQVRFAHGLATWQPG